MNITVTTEDQTSRVEELEALVSGYRKAVRTMKTLDISGLSYKRQETHKLSVDTAEAVLEKFQNKLDEAYEALGSAPIIAWVADLQQQHGTAFNVSGLAV